MRVYVESYGCTMNKGDADLIRGILSMNGFSLVDSLSEADLVVINTCTVKGPTERKMIKRIKEIKETNKKLVVSGCMSMAQPELVKRIHPKAILLGPKSVDKIIPAIERDSDFLDEKTPNKTDLPTAENSKIIQISEGCLGNCSYCIVKMARGQLKSFPLRNIIKRLREFVEKGRKEILLTALDTAAYGQDLGLNLADLLYEIDKIDGEFWVRVGMMNPSHALDFTDELVNAFKSEKIYKFLHLPVQSGDDDILEKMNRNYTVDDFKYIVNRFRKEIPYLTLSTDVIVGFPTETEEQFQNTYKLIEKIEPDVLNITRFSPRPFTEASRMKQIPDWIKKNRSRKINELRSRISLEKNKRWIGKRLKVLISEKGKKDDFIARTFSYKPVIVSKDGKMLNEFIEVDITGAKENYLLGS
ncbi:MAG: tRNA (N(6)-L-threonylcarbamoyladenosine(37)-C(2))-methylthiotransferase [Candidatus Hydrothermarchaeota archaeon]